MTVIIIVSAYSIPLCKLIYTQLTIVDVAWLSVYFPVKLVNSNGRLLSVSSKCEGRPINDFAYRWFNLCTRVHPLHDHKITTDSGVRCSCA